MKKIFTALFSLVVATALAGVAYVTLLLPKVQPAAEISQPHTAEMIERGRYLANNVVVCIDCHSDRDWNIYGGPAMQPLAAGRSECIMADSGASGIRVAEWTFPGRLCIANITPHPEAGIGSWTDGEVIRAFREGIGRDGEPLFPIMPYFILRNISDEDALAIVAYLRTLEPSDRVQPEKEVGFPMNVVMAIYPEPVSEPVPAVDPNDPIATGRYLATIARCEFCHTPRNVETRQTDFSQRFAGGVEFQLNGGRELYSMNLTPHEEGLAGWTKGQFIARMKQGAMPREVDPADNTVSSWHAYAGMTDEDLGAIYDYLQTVEAKPLGTM